MLSLDITVNGTRHCVAAPGDVATFNALVASCPLQSGRATATLAVEAVSRDHATKYVWPNHRDLTIGDVVTIRIVDTTAPDVPIASPSGMPTVDRDGPRIGIKELRAAVLAPSDTGHSLLFWAALVLTGLIVSWFAS